MYNLDDMIPRVKAAKDERGLTNDTLSELSGVPRGTLNKILGSETKDPQISNIIKIANALGVSADYLILGKAPTEPEYPALAALYSRLDSIDRVKAEAFIEGLLAADKYEGKKERRA